MSAIVPFISMEQPNTNILCYMIVICGKLLERRIYRMFSKDRITFGLLAKSCGFYHHSCE